uniref:Proto-oncogene tyrosine-protein kinase receptor Ret-like n=1 Tax=Saccoglossus kowalevskii TaxID=10224 RepID=A0ABM0MNW1_SACKO
MFGVCSKCVFVLIVMYVWEGCGLYFPKAVYNARIPTDWGPEIPIIKIYAIYDGQDFPPNFLPMLLTYSVVCESTEGCADYNNNCRDDVVFTVRGGLLQLSSLSSNLSAYQGCTFNLKVTARTDLTLIEEAETRISVTITPSQDLPTCPICFYADRETYFLLEGDNSTKLGFAQISSMIGNEKCKATNKTYSVVSDQRTPISIDESSGIIHFTAPPELPAYRVNIVCTVFDEAVNLTSQYSMIEVTVIVLPYNSHKTCTLDNATRQLVSTVWKKRLKGDVVPTDELHICDESLTRSDEYNVTILNDKCGVFQIGELLIRNAYTDGHTVSYIKPNLILKTSVPNKYTLCRLEIAFIRTTSDDKDDTIIFDVAVVFEELVFDFKEKNYYVGLHKNASQYSQIIKVNLPAYVVGDSPVVYDVVTPDTVMTEYGLTLEHTSGIIYVINSTRLRHSKNRTIVFEVQASNGLDVITTNVTIDVLSTQPKQCSMFRTKKDCESACGIGSPNGRCTWLHRDRPQAMDYSTCTPNILTCPDYSCDVLESAHPKICLQDCVDHSNVMGSVSANFPQGIRRAGGVCFCLSAQPSCVCGPPPVSLDEHDEKEDQTSLDLISTESPPAYVPAHIGSSRNGDTYPLKTIQPNSACDGDCKTLIALLVSSASVVLVVTMASIRYNQHRKRKRGSKNYNSKDMVSISTVPSDYVMESNSASHASVELSVPRFLGYHKCKAEYDAKWEFPRTNLLFEKVVGEGEFGRVMAAQALNIRGLTGYTAVAVKMTKDTGNEHDLRDLMTELSLLKQVNHPNVVKLLGACTQKGPLYVIVEFCNDGSLRSYLRRIRQLECGSYHDESTAYADEIPCTLEQTVTPRDLVSFSWQICKGMEYLSDMKLVHRDLATRNVLVSEGRIMKISDFGLTRDIYESDAYLKTSKSRIPVKWMAVESLYDQIYTTKSDVWSFGVLLWEIYTLGATPYPGIPPERLFHLLKTGYRMDKPDTCSDEVYDIMQMCWQNSPSQRPTFTELKKILEDMLEQSTEYLDLNSEVSYSNVDIDHSQVLDETKVSLLSSESE